MAIDPAYLKSSSASSSGSVDWGKILNALLTGGAAYEAAKQNNKAAKVASQPQVQMQYQLHTPYMNPQMQELMPYIMSEAQKIYQKRMGLTGVEPGDFSAIASKLSGMSPDQWLKDAGGLLGGSGFNSAQGGSASGNSAPSSHGTSSSPDDQFTKGRNYDTPNFSDGSRKFDQSPGYGTSANEDLLSNVRGQNALDLSTVDWGKLASRGLGYIGGLLGSPLGPAGAAIGEAGGKKLGSFLDRPDDGSPQNVVSPMNRNENSNLQALWEAYQRQGGGSLSNFMNSSGGGGGRGNIGLGSGGGEDIWSQFFRY